MNIKCIKCASATKVVTSNLSGTTSLCLGTCSRFNKYYYFSTMLIQDVEKLTGEIFISNKYKINVNHLTRSYIIYEMRYLENKISFFQEKLSKHGSINIDINNFEATINKLLLLHNVS